jgi:hypothetical protein
MHAEKDQSNWRRERTAGPSTASLAMKLREAPLRMTTLDSISHLQDGHDREGVATTCAQCDKVIAGGVVWRSRLCRRFDGCGAGRRAS